MDIVDKATRSRMMRGIRGTDTRPELALRQALHGLGLRFRIHGKLLPGKPDIVSRRYRALIYVHGCFWHRHPGCGFATNPKTREVFWREKFERNVIRDMKVRGEALMLGWRVATVWECSLRTSEQIQVTTSVVLEWIKGDQKTFEIGAPYSTAIECNSA